MEIKNYDDLGSMEMDTLREVGSIGTGNAATALSGLLNRRGCNSPPGGGVVGDRLTAVC